MLALVAFVCAILFALVAASEAIALLSLFAVWREDALSIERTELLAVALQSTLRLTSAVLSERAFVNPTLRSLKLVRGCAIA